MVQKITEFKSCGCESIKKWLNKRLLRFFHRFYWDTHGSREKPLTSNLAACQCGHAWVRTIAKRAAHVRVEKGGYPVPKN